ncbi:MAG: anthranilate synthase component I family protein [Cytophagales bacterium]|nr:anthranilate synthase component I family protein [Bernardetiaceae bacterium]MDW8204392.1 anthranilate synthase component I family protein [Cytophagales bacterium]
MKNFAVQTRFKRMLADTVTPVSIYFRLRDKFVNTLLLESSDYHANENAFTYICCQPVATFQVREGHMYISMPDGHTEVQLISAENRVVDYLNQFAKSFQPISQLPEKFISNGIFGYMAYDAVQYFEDIQLPFKTKTHFEERIPEIYYQVFRYVIAINHFNEELYIFEHQYGNEQLSGEGIEQIEGIIRNKNFVSYRFEPVGEERSNFTDEEFLQIIAQGKEHCRAGDVFQIVLSRRFAQPFKGDEFNVYRALRAINPSPYLFYFDYGDFKIFGSSPEAQLVIKAGKAVIHPIAGTFPRTGNDLQDAAAAQRLMEDPKENAEHIMLVDLARNDLSKHCEQVTVATFKEVQYFSHVIHLVSTVEGKLTNPEKAIQIVADTFPAGTLSGAPKYRAMQLIHQYETISRGYYGGCIGFMGFNGDFNQAIMIRSFLSVGNTLHYQAGAGVVFKSDNRSELEEVNNKLRALRTALQMATSFEN